MGCGLHTQEQAYVHIIKPTCIGKIMRTQPLAQKTKKHKNKAEL